MYRNALLALQMFVYTVEINLLFGVSHYIVQLVDVYICFMRVRVCAPARARVCVYTN